jgi:hypothetical protein
MLIQWRGLAQDSFPLHWPLVNSDHMRTRLAKRELEKKRIEDAHRCKAPLMSDLLRLRLSAVGRGGRRCLCRYRFALEDPNHRNEWQMQEICAFTDAAVRMATHENREVDLFTLVAACHRALMSVPPYTLAQRARFASGGL